MRLSKLGARIARLGQCFRLSRHRCIPCRPGGQELPPESRHLLERSRLGSLGRLGSISELVTLLESCVDLGL